ncbi:MAG: RNA polymerase sigma factor, partial [Pseudomonadota bacterium]|nr:RNA polymerase sigma factor [Pseudomonadota bacterium]
FLKKFLRRYVTSDHDIEDIIQEVYIKAHHAESEKEIEHPKAYLFSIAKNLALDELKKSSRVMTKYIEECIASIPVEETDSMESEAEANESLSRYCEAIDLLPDKCKQIYIMRKVHGLKHKDIADKLGISISSVEKHLKLGGAFCHQYIASQSNHSSSDTSQQGYSKVRNLR